MVIFFMRCNGDVLFSTMMRYRLFLDIPYHHHRCDYFPKLSESIILRCLYNFERFLEVLGFSRSFVWVFDGFLRFWGGFGFFLRAFGGFEWFFR